VREFSAFAEAIDNGGVYAESLCDLANRKHRSMRTPGGKIV